MWDTQDAHPTISQRTIQRALKEEGLSKFRARRRPKISVSTANLRLQLAQDWQGFN